jgi:GntR family transcriptional repressor for pyruvate dehydrogenase complex
MAKSAEAPSVHDEMPPAVAAALDDIFFRHAHWHSAYEVGVQRLAQAIKLGALKVGSQLPPERELVERLGVSRTTLRESIRALQQQGYLKTSRGRTGGTFVASRQIRQPSRTDVQRITKELGRSLRDLIDLRASVEPSVAELAATRATGDQVAVLRWLLERSQAAAIPDLRQTDSTLHIAIAHAAGSDLLLDLVLEEQMRLHDILAYLPFVRDRASPVSRSTRQHASVVEAIARRDAPGARRAMEQHISATNEIILSVVTQRSGVRAAT